MRIRFIGSIAGTFVLLALLAATDLGTGARAGEPDSTSRSERAGADLGPIRERAASMPIDARIDMDKRIAATVERVNRRAAEQGQNAMAARLAAEFSVTSETLSEEKGKHGFRWGELLIARTVLANSPEGLTLADLAQLRSEGLGWAAIAYGLRFRMEDLEDAIKAKGRVATGWNRPDGKAEATEK
jgi:hypothetical protein